VRAAQRFEFEQKCDPTQLVPNPKVTIAHYVQNKDNRDQRKISMTRTNFCSNMNNEAFQKLVRERAGVKTSKEIAREAVEAEFKGRGGGKRRRPRDDYSSDEDADRLRRATDRKQLRSVESKDDTKPSESQSSQKYRDRALERRQGNAANVGNNDPQQPVLPEPRIASTAEAIFDDVVAALESGDRRKLIQLRKSQTTADDTTSSRRPIATADEALAYIRRDAVARPASGNSSNTELGPAMLTYLRETYLPPPPSPSSLASQVSAAGRNIQRSQFTFALTAAHPSNVARSWEYPREDAALFLDDNDNGWVPKATPCIDEGLLAEMQQRLDRKNMAPKTQHLPPKSVPAVTAPSLTEPSPVAIPSANGDSDHDDDDDDDIFENMGDYDGKSAIQAMEDQETPAATEPKTARPSIFAPTPSSQHDASIVHCQSTNRSADAASLDMARPEQGLRSLSSYANDYDDDGIGMDFGGRDYDDEEDEDSDKKSSGKAKKTKSRKNRRERSPS
jgi:hypothetical protein